MVNKYIKNNSWIKGIAVLLMLSMLATGAPLSALGKYGDDDYDPDTDTTPPPDIDVDAPGTEPPIEIDESLPAEVQQIHGVEPLLEGELASRDLIEGDELYQETDTHALYFNEETLAVKVLVKVDDYVWSSSLPPELMSGFSSVWRSFAQSPFVIDYMDPKRPSTLNRDFPTFHAITTSENGYDLELYYPRVKVYLTAHITLVEDKLDVQIIDDEIIYEDGEDRINDIARIYMMPFWGAVEALETDGYIFLPDGSGALMRFGEARPYRSPYEERIYGRDEGISRRGLVLTRFPQVDAENIKMPVYGISHGHQQQASFMQILSGAPYAHIYASPAGVRINHFWTASIFNYIETFFQNSGRAGKGYPLVYRDPNPVNPHVRFHLLSDEDADYVGMAKRYQEELVETGVISDESNNIMDSEEFPLLINAFMADQEESFLFTRLKAMTKFSDILDWQEYLFDLAGEGLTVSLRGAQPGGVSGHTLGSTKIASKLGGKKGLNELKDTAAEKGFGLLLNTDLGVGNEPQMGKNDMVYNIDRSISYRSSSGNLYDTEYFLNLPSQLAAINNLANDSIFDETLGLDIASMGDMLFSDHKRGEKTPRGYIANEQANALAAFKDDLEVYLENPNDYLWSSVDALYNVSNSHSMFVFESDTVPFLQIVLSGYKALFAPYMNFGSQDQSEVLRSIEYNLYPNYLVTELPSSELIDSNTNDIYYSEFDVLYPEIKSDYEFMRSILDPVRGETIVAREIPASNIAVVSYSNGMKVAVNYSTSTYDYEGHTIPAMNAILIEGGA